jgi:hypothetical protein
MKSALACPCCGLHIAAGGPEEELHYCPRCLARSGGTVSVGMSTPASDGGEAVGRGLVGQLREGLRRIRVIP